MPPPKPSTDAPLRTGRRVAIAALAALLIPGCKQRGASGAGTRVISLSPSTTEAVFAIGAGALLVGRSKHCDFPPEAQTLPVVGGYSDPSLEAIIGINPTVVV
ncbi:MAG TPA: ABC transporter substrate-binding protein, partial [Polyangiaceae bacterium]|nr:ABC transporter substrate-binding protein [Polyangiaceae bacterium]